MRRVSDSGWHLRQASNLGTHHDTLNCKKMLLVSGSFVTTGGHIVNVCTKIVDEVPAPVVLVELVVVLFHYLWCWCSRRTAVLLVVQLVVVVLP